MDIVKICEETQWIYGEEPGYHELWTKHTGNKVLLFNGPDEIASVNNIKALTWDAKTLEVSQKASCINGTTFTEYKTDAIESLEVGFDIAIIRLKNGNDDTELSYEDWCEIAGTNCWELR